jgi:hypothetical protein
MVVRDDHPAQRLAHARGEQPLPQRARRLVAETAVDQRPRRISVLPVLEQPEIDVIERERQRHAQPVNARRDLAGLRGRRRRRLRVLKQGLRCHRCLYGAGNRE